jgi:CheY-like chemotaxis protein
MPHLVFIIDDNPLLLAAMGEVIRDPDTLPVLARGQDALKTLERYPAPDVIVIDVDMRDGFRILAEIVAAVDRFIPVVALSSNATRVLEAGIVDAVLAKPFDFGQFRACVRRVCDSLRGSDGETVGQRT